MIRQLIEFIHRTYRSRAVTLTTGVVLLSLCVLLLADMTNLRDDGLKVRQEAREAVAEALAVQLSSLAIKTSPEIVLVTIDRFVQAKHSVIGAEFTANYGQVTSIFRKGEQYVSQPSSSFLSEEKLETALIHVPILSDKKPWGELKIAFIDASNSNSNFLYYVFIAVGMILTNLAYLANALVQIDPSKAVPERVNNAFNLLAEGVVVLDTNLRILMINEAACSIAAKPIDKLMGRSIERWPWVKGEDWQSPWLTVLNTGMTVSEYLVQLGGNNPASYKINCSLIRNQKNQMSGIMITLDDITAMEKKNGELNGALQQLRRSQESIALKNRELEALASQDSLTGLKNRRALVAEIGRQMEQVSENQSQLACIMVDIDHFKKINDTLGHAIGDEVICAVANTLVENSRQIDTVARIGGEEFVIVLPETDVNQAADTAERIRVAIELIAKDVTTPVEYLSASLGVAIHDESVGSIEQLLDQADQALYSAKNNGRNQIMVFDANSEKQKTTLVKLSGSGATTNKIPSKREKELEQLLNRRSHDLDRLRMFDQLTGIPNRTVFVEQLDRSVGSAARTAQSLGVLSMAIRDIESLTTTLGHDASQTLIQEFSVRIRDALRRSDLVTDIVSDHNLSHISSNEFGVLLSGLKEPEQSLTVVTRIRRVLSKPFIIQGQRIRAGVNIGVALYPQDGTTVEILLEQAVRARASAARQPEKCSSSFANDAIEALSRDTLEMESDLYEAVEKSQFTINYQPKFDLSLQKVCGLEALVRWQHPEKGWISPADFIPVAEANGLIKDISTFVISTALEQLKIWEKDGLDTVSMSMNISGAQLRDPDLVSDLLEAIEHSGVSPEAVDLELTETSVIDSPQRARIALRQLRNAGVSISMDDFGTGYTSLALLADLPLDSVKIDRSFIVAMASSERSRAIVESIINMAHTLKLSVVGEGVETNEQLSTLTELGCNVIQGYLISKPMDPEKTTEFLQQQSRNTIRQRRA